METQYLEQGKYLEQGPALLIQQTMLVFGLEPKFPQGNDKQENN